MDYFTVINRNLNIHFSSLNTVSELVKNLKVEMHNIGFISADSDNTLHLEADN